MKKNTRTLRRTALSMLLAGACLPALAAGARIDFSSIEDAGISPRFIVKYRTGSTERVQPAARQRSLDAAVSRTQAAGVKRSTALKVNTLRATARGGMHVLKASQRLSRTEAETLMRQIAADPNVEYVAVDAIVREYALPNDPALATHQMWHYGTGAGGARVTTAWEQAKGAGVVVAVVDTGATAHADLVGNLLPGYDFITDPFVSRRETAERVPGGWDIGSWNAAGECGTGSAKRDSSWHGTHVAGTIAEVTNNGVDGAGVAPDAKVVPVRVLGRCGGLTSDVADAIVWAAGGTVTGVPVNANPAEVINLSLGSGQTCPQVMQDAINTAVSLGATVVVAAGNSNADAATHSPASCANVVNVASTGYTGVRASYSNYGASIDLSAPGGGADVSGANGYIWSTHNTGTTVPVADRLVGMVGTSMAAPHVAGVVALMQSAAPQPLTPATIEGLLVASARPFPVAPSPSKPIGAGILDANAAVERAKTFGQPIVSRPLTSGVVEAMPPLAAGQDEIYAIDVPAGATRLEFLSYGGRGVLRVYANYEAEPMPTMNIGASVRPGTNQTIVLSSPAAGRYYIKVVASSDSAGVMLRVKVL
ncbi:S8 family peptidase [Lysobacter cavernae]|uniref:S8 family peptidase n=1 Tax=Lysobacter cavernae TaxID=1685901 RepID=A0ABV7RKU5_9GAMM